MHHSIIDTQLAYEVQAPAHLLFNLEAARCDGQQVLEEALTVEPPLALRHYCDANSGNRFFRFDAPAGPLQLRYRAVVRREAHHRPADLREQPVSEVPDALVKYLMPTRYCESDVMARAAQQLFGDLPPGIGRVQAISDWIHDSLCYQPGSSDSTTTAQEVFVQRAGVCRDFAHLGITFCRALNIPARLVVGYVNFEEPPQDFHAIFEAWLSGQWVVFDPTRMAPAERLVRVGTGRDAKDVAFCTFFGPVNLTAKDIRVRELQDASAPELAPPRPSGILLGIEKPEPLAALPGEPLPPGGAAAACEAPSAAHEGPGLGLR
ncbi:transglutaminase family protein [Xenophilus sp. Marseille-Q4582]|uniref:transglutaminase-like domain-containing protein n=1 Tax=Xenophilus sp. Marseille-Q4582 TaxID=2866600 RepID=UPI001CE43171|nr:transglutaminase family protein [Xenophilus sp. Marseille-Q4582]